MTSVWQSAGRTRRKNLADERARVRVNVFITGARDTLRDSGEHNPPPLEN